MRHPFRVSIVSTAGSEIVTVAKRSTREKAEAQAAKLRESIGGYNREGVPMVTVTDLRTTPRSASDTD